MDTAVVVVGALIFVLGLDLVKEALWDTRHRTSRLMILALISIYSIIDLAHLGQSILLSSASWSA